VARILKGALVSTQTGQSPLIVVFQYNPEALVRTLLPVPASDGPRVREVISCTLSLDAIDLDDTLDANTQEFGLLPTLGALQSMAETAVIAAGSHVFLVWGPHRILPVRIAGLLIRETEFNPHLAPMRADVDLVLNVLEAPAQDAPAAVRQSWERQERDRKEWLGKMPGGVPDYIDRILK
jgi:hypothetical protein